MQALQTDAFNMLLQQLFGIGAPAAAGRNSSMPTAHTVSTVHPRNRMQLTVRALKLSICLELV